MTKIIAINGSPRKTGNTSIMLNLLIDNMSISDAECEYVELSSLDIKFCMACRACYNSKNMKCILNDDMNVLFQKLLSADVIILGSPTYVADVSGQMKTFIDRASYISGANDKALSRKIGAAVVAVRRAGAMHAFSTINNFFLLNDMLVIGSNYWNVGIGWGIGEVNNDTEGLDNIKKLGKNISWLSNKIKNK